MNTIEQAIKELEAGRGESEHCPLCAEDADTEYQHSDMHVDNALEILRKVKP